MYEYASAADSSGGGAARRGHKKETTCGFLLLVNLPLSLGGSGANRRPATAAKLGYGSRVTVAWLSPPFRSSQTAYCYTGRKVYAGATYPCRATLWHVVTEGTCEFRYSLQFIFVGPVYHNTLTNRAALLSPRGPSLALRAIHLVSRLRRPSDLCSSTLSVNCEKAEKATQR